MTLLSRIATLSVGWATLLSAQVPVANPTSIALSTPALSTAAVSQTLTVTGAAGQTWRVQSVGGFWLRFLASPACPASVNDCTFTTSGSTVITVLADPTGLPAFLYTGSVSVTYPGGVLTIPVTLNVGGGANSAALTATPTALTFAAAPNGNSQTQTLSLTSNGSASPVSFSVASSVPWLTTNLGVSSAVAPSNVSVTANPAGLSAGTYQGLLTFTPAGGAVAPITVNVTFTVAVAQQLVASPTTVAFSALPGGTGLTPVTVAINVASGNPVPYTATISYPGLAALNWLSLSTTSGQTGTNLILTASGATSLPAGTYAATVTISSPGLAPVFIPVSLNLSPTALAPRLVSDVNPISLNVLPAGAATRTFALTTSTAASIPYTITTQYTAPQNPAVNWLSLAFNSGSTPASVTVTASPGALPAGTYQANLLIASPTPGFAALTIPVTMNVSTSAGAAPVIGYAPTFLGFTYSGTGAIATTQNILLDLTPALPAQPATVTAVPDVSGQTWLSAVLLSPTPGTVTAGSAVAVSANATGLANGVYTGRVQVSAPSTNNPLIQIPVTLVVSGVAAGGSTAIVFSPSQLSFATAVGGSTTDQTVTLSTSGTASIPYTLSVNAPWLSLQNTSGNTPGTTTARVNSAGLAAGQYTGAIVLNAPGASNNGATVPVTLTVGSGGLPVVLSPTSLRFVAQSNGAPPPPQNFSVTSTGPSANYTVSSNQTWLQGIAATDSTPGNVAVYVNPAALPAGVYFGNLAVSANGFTVNLGVTVEVTSGPLLRLSQQATTFNYQTGQTLPAPRTMLLSGSTGAPLNVTLTAATTGGGNWLVATPATLQTPGAFAVSLANNVVTTLPPGTYTGTITANATGAPSTTLNVTLNVSTGSLLSMSTSPAIFSAETNGPPAPPQTRAITTTSLNAPLPLSVSLNTQTNAGWLSASLSTATTPATLSISASAAGLAPGVYNGTVTVSSGSSTTVASGANALVVPVTLTVSAVPALRADQTELTFSGPSNVVPQTLQLTSTSGNLSYSVAVASTGAATNWLSVSAPSGIAPSNLIVTANPALLTADGTYFGTITISTPGTGAAPLLIPVTLVVNRSTLLQVTPTALNFTVIRGAGLPAGQTVQVSSQQPLRFSFNTTVQTPLNGNWLSVTQPSAETNGTLQVAVNNAAAALPIGSYTASIVVVPTVNNQGISVPITVNLTVVANNILVATPNVVNFSGRLGQPSPAPQPVQISSTVPGVPISYNVTSDALWLSASSLAGTTPAMLLVTVNPANLPTGTAVPTGRLTLVPVNGGQTATITVSFVVEASPAPAIAGFANSATFQAGPLTPGMLVTLVGTDLGPAQAVSGNIVNGRFTTSLAGVRVLFDGIAAPILFASSTQINAAVPYPLFGRAFAQMSVEYNGQASAALAPRLADAAPGIFTTDGRQAAALNENGTVNSAANPARPGSIVVLYVTGEGQTSPGGVDGELVPAANLKRPLAAVRVRVNGVEAPEILYAGSAPGLVSGLMQINLRLPAGTPANAATPVEVIVGTAASPTGTTIAVSQ